MHLDEHLSDLLAGAEVYGFAVEHVAAGGAEPAYAHTVGLTPQRLPELALTGVDADLACLLLGLVARVLTDRDAGEPAVAGRLAVPGFQPFWLLPLAHPTRRLASAVSLYGPKVTGLQAVYADLGGRFPWEAGYEHHRQPLLGHAPA